ncbi:hypothetical protein BpHYR1_048185 [Brachionus plicatilis]|uniref:Uncharacterized protein n=1 Tax=Brachionus plicatilis TaxID=10195 RepID=A0A3M7RZK6_BRAPC|nr:hypothetical protein BpHYR1_048185 [Brachionus plicatilis]
MTYINQFDDYYKRLFSHYVRHNNMEQENVELVLKNYSNSLDNLDESPIYFTIEKIKDLLKELGRKKSPGHDLICNEFLYMDHQQIFLFCLNGSLIIPLKLGFSNDPSYFDTVIGLQSGDLSRCLHVLQTFLSHLFWPRRMFWISFIAINLDSKKELIRSQTRRNIISILI